MRLLKYVTLLLLFFECNAQNFDTACTQQLLVFRNLEKFHYSGAIATPTIYPEIIDLFIKEADERNIFFLEHDRINLLNAANLANAPDVFCTVIRQTFALMRTRLFSLDSLVSLEEKNPLEFSLKDTIYFLPRKKPRVLCKSIPEIARRLERRLKYECLNEITSPRKDSFDILKIKPAELTVLREQAKKKSVRRLRAYLRDYSNDRFLTHHLSDCMSNAIALRFDPHSNFFNPREMERFNTSLSSEESSFGFSAGEDEDGNIIVDELVPGGPAWKSNTLNEDDVILSFRFEGEKEVELENMDIQEFNDLFERSLSAVVELRVRKKDFKIKAVRLKKEKLQSQENMMNSYVIHHNGSRYGYIPIPSFYSDRENDNRLGCANDVAKEIIELKQDSITGLILDLRYNGGGSMREAMGLAGIFINEGPVSIYKMRNGKPFFLKDLNRGSIWDGALILLVNSASASASEFVTATLQDYKRALIVGSTTFGKGTAQSVMQTDSSFVPTRKRSQPPYGYMKITTGKFYRLTTASHQGSGIEPDIKVPGVIEKIMDKESDYPFYLKPDSVNKKVVFNKLADLPVAPLSVLSSARVMADTQFTEIIRVGDSLRESRSLEEKVCLTPATYKAYSDKRQSFNRRMNRLFTISEGSVDLVNNSENQKIISLSDYHKKNNDNAIENLKKDLILRESVLILSDLINLTKK
jgi:carboxyl-terminal processing protease